LATFDVTLSFHFDTEYQVEADSYEEAEQKALDLSQEWKPYSSELGYTHDWYSTDIESINTFDELPEDE
jgi:hypothetical protein